MKLDTVPLANVAFEVDQVDEEITDDDSWLAESRRGAAPPTWLPMPADHYVRIRPGLITGACRC